MDLLALAREFPDMTVSIRIGDLIKAQDELIRKARAEERRAMEEAAGGLDDLIPKAEVLRTLHVHPSTLWRWEKCKYLQAVRIGSAVYYRRSSLDRLIDSKAI